MIDSQPSIELVKLNTLAPLVSLDSARHQSGFSQGPAGPSLSALVRILEKHKWKLMAFIGLAMLAAVVLQFTLPSLYEATAEVKIDRHSTPGIIGSEASQVSSVDDMDQIITTQVQLAESDPVLRPVAEQFRLLEQEHQLKGLNAQQIDRKLSAPIELKRLKVARPPNTYLINISYRAADPKLASNVANGIAASLVSRSKETANRPYTEISAIIEKHMADLREKMDRSAQRLVQYEKDLNMVDPEQHTTILMARLEQLNTEFISAQTDRLRKEAILNEVAGSRDVATARAAEVDNQRSLLTDALQRVDVANQQFSAAKSYYGENHPEYLRAKAVLDEAQTQVSAAQTGTHEKVKADYSQALDREKKLQAILEKTKTEVDNQKKTVIEYEQLKSESERDRATFNDLERRNEEADVNDHFRDATVQLVTPARPGFLPVFPRLMVNLPAAFILSAILGILAAVLSDSFDNTFSDPEEVASEFNMDVLASIPEVRRLPPVRPPQESLLPIETEGRNAEMTANFSESIRVLRNAISLSSLDRPIRTLLMTSSHPSEGKSTTSVHLALSCSQIGKKVLLIDADMRRPTIHKHFDISCATGLSDVLTRGIPFADAIVHIEHSDLCLLPAGPVSLHASDLISIGFANLLARIAADFDLVIVDAPPMLGLAEAQEMASMVDGVLLVTKAGATKGRSVANSIAGLMRVRANVLGIVMNQVKSAHSGYGYGYSYRTLSDQKTTKKA